MSERQAYSPGENDIKLRMWDSEAAAWEDRTLRLTVMETRKRFRKRSELSAMYHLLDGAGEVDAASVTVWLSAVPWDNDHPLYCMYFEDVDPDGAELAQPLYRWVSTRYPSSFDIIAAFEDEGSLLRKTRETAFSDLPPQPTKSPYN